MHRVILTEEPLSLGGLWEGHFDPAFGAVVVFAGCVRGEENGEPIAAIRYQAYVDMARTQLERTAKEIGERFQCRVSIHHRVGLVPVKGISLLVACAAPHRAEAFDAAREIVEKIKKDVTIWKVDFERLGATL